jgi:antitoxin ChpS
MVITTTLKRVGGSVMLPVPATLARSLHFVAGMNVGLAVEGGNLVVAPAKPTYTLDELLSQCDFAAPMSLEEREWLDAPLAGRELI